MKSLLVVMVTYRRFDHFKKTLESIKATIPPGSHIVVVHNLSDEKGYSEQEVKYRDFYLDPANMKDVTWVVMGTNGGWGKALNAAFRTIENWTEYEYILESNNDVQYEKGWFEFARFYMRKYPKIGILGLWKHPYHGVRETLPDGLVIKDDMPATCWLLRSKDLQEFLPFPEHGPCKTRGGNGEDVAFRDKVQNTLGRWICGLQEDFAQHMDGYDIPDLGKENPAYL